MSPLMYREMMAGLNAEIKEDGIHSIFKDSTPYFFGNNLNLVYDTEMRKLKKKIDKKKKKDPFSEVELRLSWGPNHGKSKYESLIIYFENKEK